MDTLDLSRRQVLQRSAAAVAICTIGSLTGLHSNQALAAAGDPTRLAPIPSPYGPLSPVADRTAGLPLLQLPRGFSYQLSSWTGDAMANGQPCLPRRHGRDGQHHARARVIRAAGARSRRRVRADPQP